jgi:hypothetical protein
MSTDTLSPAAACTHKPPITMDNPNIVVAIDFIASSVYLLDGWGIGGVAAMSREGIRTTRRDGAFPHRGVSAKSVATE